MGLLRIGGFGFGVLINEILELGLRVLRERNGRAEKLQEMRVVLANMLGQGYGEIHTILIYTEWSLVAHLNGVVSATVKSSKPPKVVGIWKKKSSPCTLLHWASSR